ncbi:uncharacterized protein LOC122278502 [Carya illinoinensis]|uniref:uncharacterized protein LOC122278502 n=1 Tax=Carya illinoinensis TaxID=32201 RepID=UPI001C720439|nr:uncharacterized protein LOC122278502 [Carya illinoinensis]
MSKAYDRVEWDFKQKVMIKMGFADIRVNLVMECVSTVSYSLLINGIPQELFSPSKGIRQADPLSPYLFIICSEFLNHSLNQAELQGLIYGIPTIRGGLHVTHLLFADDSLVFCRSNPTEWNRLQQVLSKYEQVTGQRLNLDKTSIFFGNNTKLEVQETIL